MPADYAKIKCIAFDLDDTLLNKDKGLTDRTKEVLSAAVAKGIKLVPVSGRSYATLPSCLQELTGVDYVVTSNGSVVNDFSTGERVQAWLMEAKDVRSIMRGVGSFFMEGQITYEAFVDGVAYASTDFIANPTKYGVSPAAVSYIRATRKPERFIIDLIFEKASKLDSLDLILKDAGLSRLLSNAVKRATENVYITSSVPYRLEISSKDSGKAAGLKYVLDQLGISPEETMAFGDADNDIEMLSFAGIGVAMKNASMDCYRSADVVTELSCNEDGLAEFVAKNLL